MKEPSQSKATFARCRKRRLVSSTGAMALALACAFPSTAWADDYVINSEAELQTVLATITSNADAAPRIILGSGFSVSSTAFALPDKPITIDTRDFTITTPTGAGMDIAGPTGSNTLGLAGTFTGTSTGTPGGGLTLTGGGTVNSSATITSGPASGAGGSPGIALGLNGALTFVNNGTVAAGDSVSFTHTASGGNSGVAVSLNSGGSLVNNGLIQGSSGQNGSDGFAVYAGNLGGANFIVNNGTIRGGSNADLSTGGAAIRGSGAAPMTLTNESGGVIEGGNGSAAILAFNQTWGVSVINSGTISAGAGGANAIDMGPASGSNLTLELRAGSTINGNVVASTGGNDILRFGGAADATFDMANIGATKQFRNFDFLSKSGTSTWTLTGDGTIGNAWSIAQGTLVIGEGGTTGPTFTGMLNDGTLEFRRSTAMTVSGFVNGSGRIVQSGAGTTTLTASSGYSGGTLITGGVLQFGFDGAIGTGGVTVDGGTLRFTGSAAGTTRTTILGANGGTFDIATAGGIYTASGFTGAGALTKLGAGTLVLNGDNTHTGGTTIEAGSLRINGTIAGNIVDNGTLIFGNATAYTHAGSITGTGNVTTGGSALLTLTGNSNFGGGLTSNSTGGLLLTNGANISWGGATTLSAIDGSLSVTGGAMATAGGAMTLGRNTLLVDGANSVFSTTALTSSITSTGSGIVNVTNGGTLRLTGGNLSMRALGGGTAVSALRISGPNALVDVSGGLLGASATAANIFEATISAGATLRTAGASQIGIATSTQPLSVTITGAGSNWSSTGSLAMTTGTFTLDQGGAASFASASFGASGTPTIVSVAGIGSSLTTTGGDLVIGSGTGIGSLDLSNGGSANIGGSLLVGAGSTVALSGGSARVGGNLVVGTASGNGALTLANGSSVDVTGNLVLGTGGAMGELVLASGDTVNVGGSLILADNAGATGILSIGAADGSRTPDAPGAFTASMLAFGSAGSILNFNHDATDYVFAAAISGAGTINQRAGDTNLTGDSSAFTGVTNVSGGRLRVNGTLGDATSAVNVLNGGTLGGAGTIGGGVSVDDGTIAPGNSPGTLTIAGNLSLTDASLLDYEFGHSDVVGGPLNDLVQVGGDLTLDGTINVTVTPGGSFDPGLYRVIGYAGSLTDNGLTAGTVPGGSLVEVQTSILGQVNLVNHAGIDVNFWDGGVANDGVVSGGSGLWQGAGGNSHWTLIDGTLNTAYPNDAFAIFSAAAGTVTVDASLGAVNASGIQFASDGYVITGDAIGLSGSQSVIRVGDGTTAGASFTATIGSNVTAAGDLFKTDLGTLVLTGANTVAGDTYARSGLLRISGGGTLSNVNGLVGPYAGDQAVITVTGAGSAWNNSGDLWVGYDGTGTLNVTNGGLLASTTGSLGVSAGSIGNVVVSGTGSSWQNGGRIALGLGGTGNLRIEAGAAVSSDDAIVGESALGNALITGAGSSWSNMGQLTVGSYAAGTLRIEDGATVTSNQGYVGAGPGSDGSVLVTGAGSNWQVSAYNIIVGHNATGSLAIENGGLVHAERGVLLGTFAGSSGTLTMQGIAADRAVLETPGIQAGLGTVNLTLDGALLRATTDTGAFFDGFDGQDIAIGANGLAFDTDSYAVVASPTFTGAGALIKDGAGALVLSGDSSYGGGTTINAGFLQIGTGGTTGSIAGNVVDNGDLSFYRSDAASFGGLISGSGSVTQIGPGTLTLTGTNSYTGATNVRNDGTLLINGDQSAATGLTTVAATATLGGTGIIGGSVDMSAGGTLAPGSGGAGTLTILGGLTLSTDSILAYDFGAANAVGSPLNDLVNVGGNLVLDGTINVSQAAGGTFDIGLYRIANYGGTLTDNGLAIGTMPAGADLTVQTSLAGQVNLVNTGSSLLNFWDGAAGPKFDGAIAGGSGIWSATGTDNWTDVTGAVNAAFANGAIAIFAGAAGIVTIDNGQGMVTAAGLQFAAQGDYLIQGATLTLTGPQSVIRVGDGSNAGIGYTANIQSVIAGDAQLVKTDLGQLSLAGANTYTGGTAINGGVLEIASDANLGAASGSLVFDGGTLNTAGDISSARAVALAGQGVFATDAGTTLTLTGAISGIGNLAKTGSGTLILAGTGSFTGGTQFAQGTLLVNGNYATATGLTTVAAGATLGGTGTIGGDVALNGTLAPGVGGAGTLTIGGNLSIGQGAALAYEFGSANAVGGALNDLVDVGGNLVLDGTINVSQTAGGAFDVGVYRVFNYGGTLIDNGLTLGSLPAGSDVAVQTSIAGQVNLVNSAGLTLNFWDGAAGPKNNGAIDGGSGVWQSSTGNDNWTDATGATNGSYSDGAFAVFGGAAGTVAVDDGLGQVTASGMQFTTGGYTITGGAIALTGGQSVIRLGDGSTAGAGYTATINAPLTGASQLVKTDAGTLVLGGANTYTGGTLVTGGTVQIASDANLGAASGSVTLDGGTLATSATFSSSRSLVLQGMGTLSTAGGTTFTLAGPLSGVGDLTKAGTGTLVLNDGNAGYAGATRVAAGTLAVAGALGGTTNVDAAGRIEGTGTLGTVVNSGIVAPGISGVGTLTLTGNYTGVNGTLEIEAALGGDGARADQLVVGGSTAGTTRVKVINLGGNGAPTVQGIKIIDVTGASNGVFTLDGDYVFEGAPAVIAGAYGYRLYKNGVATPTDGDWYLRSALLSRAAPPETPLYQPGVPVYEAYGQTLATLNAIGTMQERVGNRRWSAGSDGISGIWGRMESARSRPNAVQSTSFSRLNVDSWKIELGVDQTVSTSGDGSTFVAGVLASYGEARADIASPFGNGSIKARGYGAGATLSWFGPQGFYVDGRAQFTWFDSTLKSNTLGELANGNNGTGQAYSIEVGKRSSLSGKLSVTPQIQMVYTTVGFDRFTDPNGAEVSSRVGNSLKTRWGISLDRQDATSHLYGVVNLSYEWLDGTVTQVSGTPIVRSNERFWGEFGLGGSVQLGRVMLYSQLSANTALRDFGKSYSLKGIAGLRLAF